MPAKDQKHKLGALFFNPGGPGGAGGSIFAAGLADAVLPQFRDRYDLVSFDPRGTGSSGQLNCGPVLRPGVPVFPKSQAQYDALVASSRATGEQCLKQHGNLMRNLDTRTVAHDMDAIRAALGEQKFNYIGLSYRSYLGTLYAQQFPQRVGRMVLDGIVDHKQGSLKFMLDEAKGDGSDFANISYVGDLETAYAAVSCMDLPGELHGYADARARMALAKAVAPRVGAAVEGWAITAACAGWPIPPSNPWQATPVRGTAPILITSTLHDPSTPVANARSLARQIDNSRLLTADTYGHTAYFNSACARDRITDYLLDGKLPKHGC